MGFLDDLKKDKMMEQAGTGGHIGVDGDFAEAVSGVKDDIGEKFNNLMDRFKGDSDDEEPEDDDSSEEEDEEEDDDSSEDGDDSSEDDDDSSNDEDNSSDDNNDSSDNNDDSSDNNDDSSDNNDDSSDNNDDSSDNNDDSSDNNDDSSDNNDDSSDNKDDSSDNNDDSSKDNDDSSNNNNDSSKDGENSSEGDGSSEGDSSDASNNSESGSDANKDGNKDGKGNDNKNKNKKEDGNSGKTGDASKDKKGIGDKAADKKGANGAKGAGKGAQEGAKGAGKGAGKAAQGAGKAAQGAGKGVQAAGTKAAAKAAGGAVAKAGATKALAAAGPWGAVAAAVLTVLQNPEVVFIFVILILVILLCGIILLFMALAIIALLLKAVFDFFFKILLPDDEEDLTEDSTPEDRYIAIAKIIRKKVKDDYEDMLSEWRSDLAIEKINIRHNAWGIALRYCGYSTPNLKITDENSLKVKLGTGWNADEKSKHNNWAYEEIYESRYPEGLHYPQEIYDLLPEEIKELLNGFYLSGKEPYFDYEYSASQMDDSGNNGAIKNMAYLVAGYNASRAEMPISESGKSWFARAMKSYYWDITADTWWTGLKSWIGVDDYFNYTKDLKNDTMEGEENRTRDVYVYQPLYWADVVVQKQFTYKQETTIEPIGDYGISDSLRKDTISKPFYLCSNEDKTKKHYECEVHNAADEGYTGVAWSDEFYLTDEELLGDFYNYGQLMILGGNYYPSIFKQVDIRDNSHGGPGTPINVTITYNEDATGTGQYSKFEWYKIENDQAYTEKQTVGGTYELTPGNIRYTDEKEVYTQTEIYHDISSVPKKTKPTSWIDDKTNLYYQRYDWYDTSTILPEVHTHTGSHNPNPSLLSYEEVTNIVIKDEKVGEPVLFNAGSPDPAPAGYEYRACSGVDSGKQKYQLYQLGCTYQIKSYQWTCKLYKYNLSYTYDKEQVVDRGVKLSTKITLESVTNSKTATFNKSYYTLEEDKDYTYYYLDASASCFDNSKFVELMFEKSNPYYEELPTLNVPAFYDEKGTYHPAVYDMSYSTAVSEGLLTVKPKNEAIYKKNKDDDEPYYGGIYYWPYFGNVSGFEYECCGSTGVQQVCTGRPSDSLLNDPEALDEALAKNEVDLYNNDEDGESCGCGEPAIQEEMEEDSGEVSTMNKNSPIRSIFCEMITYPKIAVDSNGDPILDAEGNTQYVEKVKIKTVGERVDEICEDFKYFLENYEAVETMANTGISGHSYGGDATELAIYTLNIFKQNEKGSYGKVVLCTEPKNYRSYKIGIFMWSKDKASELIRQICEASPATAEKLWQEVLANDPKATSYSSEDFFLMNHTAENSWVSDKVDTTPREEHCDNAVTVFEYKLSELLLSETGQDIQDQVAISEVNATINKINSTYGVTQSAALVWLADIVLDIGWDEFVTKFDTTINLAKSSANGPILTELEAAYLNGFAKTDTPNSVDRRSVMADYLYQDMHNVPADWCEKAAGAGADPIIYETSYNSGTETMNVVYYCQKDDWKDYDGYTCASNGCGPTSCAIVAATYLGQEITPNELIDWAVNAGQSAAGDGSYHTIVKKFGEDFAIPVTDALTKEDMVTALGEGKLVMILMEGNDVTGEYYSDDGHFLVLRGLTSDGNILVADPDEPDKTKNTIGWSPDVIWNNQKDIINRCDCSTHVWIMEKP